MSLQEYLKIKEASEFLGVSPNTLLNWARDGKITTRRHPINGYRLFKRYDLARLLEAVEHSIEGNGIDEASRPATHVG